jgi:hypothetical protein
MRNHTCFLGCYPFNSKRIVKANCSGRFTGSNDKKDILMDIKKLITSFAEPNQMPEEHLRTDFRRLD